jgi:hypothetical protein
MPDCGYKLPTKALPVCPILTGPLFILKDPMKLFSISAAAAALLLCGCAAPSGDGTSAREEPYEQGEYTVGSLFPQKNKQRAIAAKDSAPSPATMNVDTMQSR